MGNDQFEYLVVRFNGDLEAKKSDIISHLIANFYDFE